MAKLSLEIKVSFILIISVIMILSAGYLTYMNLNSIVNTLKVESTPDLRLLSLKELSADLTDADNSVRLYLATNNEDYLEPFYQLMQTADERMERLYYYNEDIPYQLTIIDSISILVEKKLEVWNKMLNQRNDSKVEDALDKLSEKFLSEVPDTITEEEEQGFLKRIFSRKKEEEPPSIQKQELKEEFSRLEEIRRLDSLENLERKRRESALLERNKELSNSLNRLISHIEAEENASLAREARQADELAANTFNWLIIFGISLFILLVLVLIVIINYVRKTNVTQKALNAARIQAENLARTKELFMANVSHEMRTPMNAIYGLSEQLLLRRDVPAEAHTQLDVIGKSAAHMLAVINDILDFSRIRSGKIQLENIHFSLHRVIEEVYQLNAFQADGKDIFLKKDVDPNVPDVLIGDPVRLKQILLNVVSNAIKFTDEGGVALKVSAQKEGKHSHKIRIRVSDTGIGIEKERLKSIFEDFTQEEKSTTRKYGGTGLGLAIVKNLTELMGGSVNVESEKNKGTVFRLTFPFREGDPSEIEEEPGSEDFEEPDFKGLRVLIVDDEEYNRLVLRIILKKWNVYYKEAGNGEEAISMLMKEPFDLILMDIRMPVMDGIEATRIIKKEQAIPPELRIVGLSATNAKDDVEACFAAGMDSFLLKPFNEKSLYKTIEYLFGQLNLKTAIQSSRPVEKISSEKKPEALQDDEPDLEELYRLGSGDKEFVYELARVFIENSGSALNQMDKSLKKKDWKAMAETAHRISSSCSHMKALSLLHFLKRIEKIGRDSGSYDEMPVLLEKAHKARQKFVEKLETHMNKIKKELNK